MRLEISSAANFLVDLARLNSSGMTEDQLEKFRENVCDILLRHYTDHWFPDKPVKGSGYRCIRINGKLDPLIARAGFMMGLAVSFLRSLFPSELTMWVDPMEVAYRIGENGSICVLYEVPPPHKASSSPPPNETKTPVKALPPPPPPTPQESSSNSSSPPPALPSHHQLQHQQQHVQHHHHHHHHHFSPSKPVVLSSFHHSPPLSPVTTQQHFQHSAATAMQLGMLFKDGGNLVKCKESLRGGLEARPLHMDRLFVSS